MVLLTGYGGPEVARAATTEAGAHRYREKPWSGEDLAQDVERLLGEYWSEAKAQPHPTYREVVGAAELKRLWSRFEPVTSSASAAVADPTSASEDPEEVQALRRLLATALSNQDPGDWPSEAALGAFLLGTATESQIAEVRSAALGSAEFRKELAYLMAQVGRLDGVEARMAYEEAKPPEWIQRLGERARE
jgi:hypothetical protein